MRVARFDPRTENHRAGLALAHDTVHVWCGSHEDATPSYGRIPGYRHDGSSIKRTSTFKVASDPSKGGVWMRAAAAAVEGAGDLYVLTGNAAFNAQVSDPPNDDYGDSFLRCKHLLRRGDPGAFCYGKALEKSVSVGQVR
ncbi:MAG: hypothetical protein HIU85_15805 [Proteobacteria bacterium]|nr:hypothetical protein [Pseudomonadota bacterium]